MKRFATLLLMMVGACAAPPPEALPIPPAQQSELAELNRQSAEIQQAANLLQAKFETVRLKVCLAAKVTLEECGQFDQKGGVTKLPKPEPKPQP